MQRLYSLRVNMVYFSYGSFALTIRLPFGFLYHTLVSMFSHFLSYDFREINYLWPQFFIGKCHIITVPFLIGLYEDILR